MSDPASLSRLSRCAVYPAAALRVETGALMGDPIGAVEDVVAGDIYTLSDAAGARELVLARHGGAIVVAPGSSVGRAGQPVAALARHQIMGERGVTVEVLVLDLAGERLALPLGPLSPGDEYTLIATAAVAGELAAVAQVSFTRGTRITMSDGAQVPVERLKPGDRVLTRDHGVQPIRWTGRQTVRAEGLSAPVVIAAGALNNAEELVLSPDHRLFIYQREDRIGAGRAELLVRARHLVNGDTIRRAPGGHVDYFHLLFDAHEIIYAECIPAESLLVAPEVLAGLGEDLAGDVTRRMAGRSHRPHHGVEPTAADLDGLDAAMLLGRGPAR
ncbi:Hint domain-containing protein [Jannaschia ovalis]|uniref:Hint domain-containing protein n=1 Tax=Jannaschia ovalis TaxID=3038773 RepID=A0ABY8L9E2_9RHOB|nr:Hint domain-containing protein [Jannaschia sp. GRR-S6-38]WGH77731.1 Hint domain-containing protein [Jannaschia sp. GRR-S6-38]